MKYETNLNGNKPKTIKSLIVQTQRIELIPQIKRLYLRITIYTIPMVQRIILFGLKPKAQLKVLLKLAVIRLKIHRAPHLRLDLERLVYLKTISSLTAAKMVRRVMVLNMLTVLPLVNQSSAVT